MDQRNMIELLEFPDREIPPERAALKTKVDRKEHFIPSLPLCVIQRVVQAKAEKALPLILAIHRQLYMAKRESTPLNAAIWNAAGNPTTREREGIIRKLKSLHDIIIMEEKRTVTSRYRVGRGQIWDK